MQGSSPLTFNFASVGDSEGEKPFPKEFLLLVNPKKQQQCNYPVEWSEGLHNGILVPFCRRTQEKKAFLESTIGPSRSVTDRTGSWTSEVHSCGSAHNDKTIPIFTNNWSNFPPEMLIQSTWERCQTQTHNALSKAANLLKVPSRVYPITSKLSNPESSLIQPANANSLPAPHEAAGALWPYLPFSEETFNVIWTYWCWSGLHWSLSPHTTTTFIFHYVLMKKTYQRNLKIQAY